MRLTPSENYCLNEVKRHDHDRYLAALFLPAEKRAAGLALIAFNLEIARTREIVSESVLGQIRLQWWRETIDGLYDGTPREHPVVETLHATIREHDLPREPLGRLIDAREADLEDEPPADLMALESYARDTSGELLALVMRCLASRNDEAEAAAERIGELGTRLGVEMASQKGELSSKVAMVLEAERPAQYKAGAFQRFPLRLRKVASKADALRAAQASGRGARVVVTGSPVHDPTSGGGSVGSKATLGALEGLRPDTLYLSTGGGWSPASSEALLDLAVRADALLVAATDNNTQGETFAERLEALAADAGSGFVRLRPELEDWNEDLKAKRRKKDGREKEKDGCRMPAVRLKGEAPPG